MKETIRFAQWVVNLSELDTEIEKYMSNNGVKPYLFMNDDSVESFEEDFDKEEFPYINIFPWKDNPCEGSWLAKTCATVGEYRGCKIYLNRELDYGEVEIR